MVDAFLTDKKIVNLEADESGEYTLISVDKRGIIISDIIVSKEGHGRTILQLNDGKNIMRIANFIGPCVKNMTFDKGLTFWKGANLEVIKEDDDYEIITIGYLPTDRAKSWEVYNL